MALSRALGAVRRRSVLVAPEHLQAALETAQDVTLVVQGIAFPPALSRAGNVRLVGHLATVPELVYAAEWTRKTQPVLMPVVRELIDPFPRHAAASPSSNRPASKRDIKWWAAPAPRRDR